MLAVFRFFPLLLVTTSVMAQQRVTGNVQSADGQSLAHATVLLLNAKDSSLAKGAIADPAGTYTFSQLRPWPLSGPGQYDRLSDAVFIPFFALRCGWCAQGGAVDNQGDHKATGRSNRSGQETAI